MSMNLKDMTIEQLKATAYDQLALIENAQNNIRAINQEIANKQVKPKVDGK